jgi:hypothetical protein
MAPVRKPPVPQAGARVDAVGHEGGHGARRVVFAGIAGRLQVVENLLVDVAEMLALAEIVEVDLVDPVDHLPHQLAGLHVVVGVLEHVPDDTAPVARPGRGRQLLQRREQLPVDEGEQRVAGNAFRVGRPAPPLQLLRDRRAIGVLRELQLLVLVVDDLEEEHPAQLADALGIAIDATVLAHDVLDGFDGITHGHN